MALASQYRDYRDRRRFNRRNVLVRLLKRDPGYFACRQLPRVKSGNFIGALPFATDRSESGPGTLHAAAS